MTVAAQQLNPLVSQSPGAVEVRHMIEFSERVAELYICEIKEQFKSQDNYNADNMQTFEQSHVVLVAEPRQTRGSLLSQSATYIMLFDNSQCTRRHCHPEGERSLLMLSTKGFHIISDLAIETNQSLHNVGAKQSFSSCDGLNSYNLFIPGGNMVNVNIPAKTQHQFISPGNSELVAFSFHPQEFYEKKQLRLTSSEMQSQTAFYRDALPINQQCTAI